MEHFGTDCNVCDNEATLQCTRCKTARYCSEECQKLDWAGHEDAHKLWCFDINNPDMDHIEDLVNACLMRQAEEDDSEDDDEYVHVGTNIDGDSEHELDIGDPIEWIQVEMEQPQDIGKFVEKVKMKKLKGQKTLGKLQQKRGQFRKWRGKRLKRKGKDVKGARLKRKGSKDIEVGKKKVKRARRKIRKLRKKKRWRRREKRKKNK